MAYLHLSFTYLKKIITCNIHCLVDFIGKNRDLVEMFEKYLIFHVSGKQIHKLKTSVISKQKLFTLNIANTDYLIINHLVF